MGNALRGALGIGFALLMSGCDRSPTKQTPTGPAPLRANAALPSGSLDRRNLIEFSMAVRDYKPKDEFSTQTLDDGVLVGRTFRFDLNMADPANADLPKLFRYDVDKKVLDLTVYPGPIQIYSKTTDLPSETRSNAFGATVQVMRKEVEGFSVGPITDRFNYDRSKKPDEMGVLKLKSEYDATFETTNYSFDELEKTIPMTPDRARDVSQELHMIVEGVVTKDGDRRAVECDRTGSAATISSPLEMVFNRCTVSARFTRIQITSPKGGVLASWQ